MKIKLDCLNERLSNKGKVVVPGKRQYRKIIDLMVSFLPLLFGKKRGDFSWEYKAYMTLNTECEIWKEDRMGKIWLLGKVDWLCENKML